MATGRAKLEERMAARTPARIPLSNRACAARQCENAGMSNATTLELVVNGITQRLDPAPANVADLVRALNLEGKRIAVERNGEIVPKSRYADTCVRAGDRLEVVAAVGGG